MCEPSDSEPALLFHEFIFLLGRIAANCVNTSDYIAGKINDFFVEKLGFHKVKSIDKAPHHLTYDDITKRGRHHGGSQDGDPGIFSDEDEDEDEWGESDEEEEGELDENQKRLMEFLAKKAEEEKDFIIDYDQILNELDGVLPTIPPKPLVE